MNTLESDESYRNRICQVLPVGAHYMAEDLGNASGEDLDALGNSLGVSREGGEVQGEPVPEVYIDDGRYDDDYTDEDRSDLECTMILQDLIKELRPRFTN